jgi:hypothetical protein
LLAGAAALGAAAVTKLGSIVANAAVPQAGTQAPGFYRYKVGSFECTSINDGARSFPMPDKFVVNAAVPIGALPAGDFVVRAVVGVEGQAAGRVYRTFRKAQ